jgi:hypothetical protein
MATVQEPRSRPKYDDFLDARLNRARQQVRAADLTVASLGLIALTFGFGLVMLLLDRWLELPIVVRQFALSGYLVAATAYILKVFRRPFIATINPYYAARQVERTLPEAKNSLVSWLDLRDEPLPGTVREAVSRRAASDLDRADMDEAVRDTRLSKYGAIAGLFAVALIILLCVYRPTQFISLLARTFAPFSSTAIAHRTRIELLEPKDGDITVPINYAVDVRVDVDGRVPRADEPDALRLKFRYSDDDPAWEEKRLEPTDRSGEWTVRVPAAQVRNGFEYQVTGGDAATPLHRVRVRARSLLTEFEVHYHYRPYLHFADDTRNDPNLQAVRGTEVTILAKANRPVRDGKLSFKPVAADGKEQVIDGQRMPDQPDTLQYSMVMQQDGQYRLRFIAADGEPSDEAIPYDIHVLPDNPPAVEITHPAPEKLPVNGTLTLTGKVTDDFGLTKARLMMVLKPNAEGPGESLPPLPFNAGKPLPAVEGREPRALSIKEVVPLDELKDVAGGKIELRPGMVITYRYEAEDNCDFPKPQLGQSKEFTVTLIEPQAQDKRDAERQQASQEKKEHDEKPQSDGNGDQPPDANNSPNQGDQPNDQPMNPGDQQTIDQAKRIADQLNKNDKPNDGKGDQNQPNKNSDQPESNKGDQNQQSKDGGKPDANQKSQPDKSGKPKDGAPDKNQAKANESKDKGNDSKTGDSKPEMNKTGQPDKSDKPQDDNNQPSGDQSKQASESKQEQMNQPGQQRDENNKAANDQKQKADNKSQPANKTSDAPEKKNANDKTEKSGEKPGTGAKEDKPNDTTPKTSPDKGNADKGQPGSQRAGEGQNDGEKTEKPKDAAMSGKADQKAGKPDGDKPQGAQDQGEKKPNAGEPTQPEPGGATKPQDKSDKTKRQSIRDAEKPHDKPGEKPSMEPKSKGTDGKPQPSDAKANEKAEKSDKPDANAKPQAGEQKPKEGDTKPQGGEGAPKPPDIQKLINDYKKSDERNREMIMKQLEKQANEAKTPERKKAADEAVKECKECNSPTDNPGAKSKPSTNSGGDGKSAQPGQGKGGDQPKPEGEKPNPDGKMQPKAGDGQAKPGDTGNEKTKMDGENKPEPKGQPGEMSQSKGGEPGKDKSKEDAKGDGPAQAAGKRDGDADFGPDSGKAPPPNEKFLREAGDLQLEQFKNKVDRKVLEQLKMTDDEYQAFLRSYENLVKRSKDMPKPSADDRARGAAKGGSSANSGAKKAESGPKTGPQTGRGGRGPAPPEFREQYKEFTEDQSKQAKPKDR